MRIENSKGVFEDASWHGEAAVLLRQTFKERGQLFVSVGVLLGHTPERFAKEVCEWLRTHGFSEEAMGVFDLMDHVWSVLELALNGG